MKNHYTLLILTLTLLIFSCDNDTNEITTPNIKFENPKNDFFLIGENISISILVNHDEVLDNVKYYETLNCSDDNYDSINLLEWENIYETEWSFQKNLITDNYPEDLTCTCIIQVEVTDLKNIMNQSEIILNISNSTAINN